MAAVTNTFVSNFRRFQIILVTTTGAWAQSDTIAIALPAGTFRNYVVKVVDTTGKDIMAVAEGVTVTTYGIKSAYVAGSSGLGDGVLTVTNTGSTGLSTGSQVIVLLGC